MRPTQTCGTRRRPPPGRVRPCRARLRHCVRGRCAVLPRASRRGATRRRRRRPRPPTIPPRRRARRRAHATRRPACFSGRRRRACFSGRARREARGRRRRACLDPTREARGPYRSYTPTPPSGRRDPCPLHCHLLRRAHDRQRHRMRRLPRSPPRRHGRRCREGLRRRRRCARRRTAPRSH